MDAVVASTVRLSEQSEGSNMGAVVASTVRFCTRCEVCWLHLSGGVLGMENSLVKTSEVVTRRDEVRSA